MNFERIKRNIIHYPPTHLRTFEVMAYEWIDNLCFTIKPEECLEDFGEYIEYIEIVKELFLNEGWDGDGDIELMWIPPFMFDGPRTDKFTMGVTVWHVKQKNDGISWILHPPGIFTKKIE